MSIISYGRLVSIDIDFDEKLSVYEYYRKIDTNLTHQGGNQSVLQAMDTVLKIFSERELSIFGFNKYCVLFSHGKEQEAVNMEALTKSMQLLKAQRVKVLEVGIGKASASGVLREYRDDVIIADSFEDLSSMVYPLTKRVCTASAEGKIALTNVIIIIYYCHHYHIHHI